eukprot:TRINITY_DN39024_c0_g1_i1.p1 TRINITY_DN39024_c0_g1~~TRINITY_DN39024_c0_g1_i1.p1  ORF type:complete len:114 (+),score=4.02 TRINITY_DN39024_c0_g1_i1:306-647(+)
MFQRILRVSCFCLFMQYNKNGICTLCIEPIQQFTGGAQVIFENRKRLSNWNNQQLDGYDGSLNGLGVNKYNAVLWQFIFVGMLGPINKTFHLRVYLTPLCQMNILLKKIIILF